MKMEILKYKKAHRRRDTQNYHRNMAMKNDKNSFFAQKKSELNFSSK